MRRLLALHDRCSGLLSIGVINALGGDSQATIVWLRENTPLLIPVLKLSLSVPLTYHCLASLRHMVWSNPVCHCRPPFTHVVVQYWDATAKGLTISESHNSSIALIGASGVLGLALASYSIEK